MRSHEKSTRQPLFFFKSSQEPEIQSDPACPEASERVRVAVLYVCVDGPSNNE